MTSKRKKIIRIITNISVVAAGTFFGGYFAPRHLLEDYKTIITILLSTFGVALTAFVFMQNIVQTIKTNILKIKEGKISKSDQFKKLDDIVNELMGNIKWLVASIIAYVIIVIFLIQINNTDFQEFLRYVQYFIFSISALAILDLILTTFTLIKICSEINYCIIADAENK